MSVRWSRRERARVRRAPVGSTGELSPEFQSWAFDQLVRGLTPPALVTELVQAGVSRPMAARTVAELSTSPLLKSARALVRHGTRLALVQRLLTLQARLAANPSGIERRATPSAEELFDRYLAASTPVVFTDLVPRWPAYERWSPAFLRERYGHALIEATLGREADPLYDARTEAHSRPMTLAEFVDRTLSCTESNDFYMVAKNKNIARTELRALFDDVVLPQGWFRDEHLVGSSALWFGPRGTVTPLHHDASSILFCQVYGRKRFRLASPLEVSLLEGAHHMYSAVDPEVSDDPRIADVTFKDVVLEPGEALFIPAGWWHHVRALDVSISLAVNHFACPNSYDEWYRPGDL